MNIKLFEIFILMKIFFLRANQLEIENLFNLYLAMSGARLNPFFSVVSAKNTPSFIFLGFQKSCKKKKK